MSKVYFLDIRKLGKDQAGARISELFDAVGVGKLAHGAVRQALEVGLAGDVPGEEQARADAPRFQELDQLPPLERSSLAYGQWETEPGGLRFGQALRQDEELLKKGQAPTQSQKIPQGSRRPKPRPAF